MEVFGRDFFLFCFVTLISGNCYASFTNNCLKCIADQESHERCVNCKPDQGSDACGMYQIHEKYYTDCYKPGNGWKTCTTGDPNGKCINDQAGKQCSETCVKNYMARYGSSCVGSGRTPICSDYAGIHNGGPKGCTSSSTAAYRKKVEACCAKIGGCG